MFNVLILAIVFGILYAALFFEKSIGLSMVLFALPFSCFIIQLLEKNNKIVNKKAEFLLVPITLLSSTYFIFYNHFFYVMNLIVIPVLIAIMVLELFSDDVKFSFVGIKKILSIIFKPLRFVTESFNNGVKVLSEKYSFKMDDKKRQKLIRVIKAILVSFPIVFVVTMLLASADQIFNNLFADVFSSIFNAFRNIELSSLLRRIVITVLAFLYLLGFFYYITFKYDKRSDIVKENSYDNFTIKLILAVLNILYLVFCIIQVHSLFMRHVDINYAEYARQGFFQLMIVSVINLVTILVSKRNDVNNRYVKVMCLVMVVFTFIILASSAYRMYLYESAYGYTLLRLLVYCSLFAECLLLVPTVLYIINVSINLPRAYFIILLGTYLCMNFANFDFAIAKRNVDRYFSTGKIDVVYLEYHTRTDAVGQLTRILESDTEDDKVKNSVRRYLNYIYDKLDNERMDFRDFNLSKIRAKKQAEKYKE